eukprot:767726-Hanusia_phi.AAC.7
MSPLRRSSLSSAGPPLTMLVITMCPSARFSNSMPSHPGCFRVSLSWLPSKFTGFQFGTCCRTLKRKRQFQQETVKSSRTISGSMGR